jgi:hypothetical protein
MIGGNYDINSQEGSTLELEFEYLDVNSNLINISSSLISFIVKKTSIKTDEFMFEINSDRSVREGTVLYPSTSEIYGEIVKGTTGKFSLKVNADTMESLSPGTYFYSLYLTSGSTVTPLCKGRFYVESKVK